MARLDWDNITLPLPATLTATGTASGVSMVTDTTSRFGPSNNSLCISMHFDLGSHDTMIRDTLHYGRIF